VVVFTVPVLWSELFARVILRSQDPNAAQRGISNALKVSAWAGFSLWVIAWLTGLPPFTTLTVHYALVGSNWLLAAAVFHRRGAIVGVACVAAALLSLAFPTWGVLIGGACSFAGFATLSWTQRPAARG
jgi:hypothetical protein